MSETPSASSTKAAGSVQAAPQCLVGICGGAVAGSEAARMLAERGALVLVIEQNARPYGKIEDGLPRWHEALRRKEYAKIDANLDHPNILFMPLTRLGRDVSWEAFSEGLGLSALILATGAWRDRPLPEPIHRFNNKGLLYQNAVMAWFNHYEEPDYDGPRLTIPDATIVVGGGLASIDVAKLANLEIYGRALRAMGHEVDLMTMERVGIPQTLQDLGVEPGALKLEGVRLFYRRRGEDMPLASARSDAPEDVARAEKTRLKILDKVKRKFLVRFEERCLPSAPLIIDGAGPDGAGPDAAGGGRLGGLVFHRTRLEGRKVVAIEGSELSVHAELVISSIGSLPEPLAGIPMKGELYAYDDWESGRLEPGKPWFGLGNALTGKGNIKSSRRNARDVIDKINISVVGEDDNEAGADRLSARVHETVSDYVQSTVDDALAQPTCSPAAIAHARAWVSAQWQRVGYSGDYRSWINANGPQDA